MKILVVDYDFVLRSVMSVDVDVQKFHELRL